MDYLITEILKDLQDMTVSPLITKILLLMILGGISFMCTGMILLFKYFKARFEEVFREIKYSQDYQAAMDSALEHSLKNGYAIERDRKLDLLNNKYSRVHNE